MKELIKIKKKYKIFLIEDAAHALGATYDNGNKVGCCENSLMTIFSFHPVKAIAAGEGGMITTNDEVIYRKLLNSYHPLLNTKT
jgi:dTDP-4-amino-4,6-dideoxygalactose transaminase